MQMSNIVNMSKMNYFIDLCDMKRGNHKHLRAVHLIRLLMRKKVLKISQIFIEYFLCPSSILNGIRSTPVGHIIHNDIHSEK